MKFKRNEKLNKAEKLGKRELLKNIFFIAFLMFVLLLVIFKYAANFDNVTLVNYLYSNLTFTLAIIFACIAIIIFVYFSSKKSFIDEAYRRLTRDYSKQLVEKMLVPGEPTKINLTNTRKDTNKYFILGLQEQGICEFYAVLQENSNSITIFSKTNNKEDLLFDAFSKEEFTTYCEFPDN